MQPINNVFDHPLSVGDAATLSLFRFSQCLGFMSTKVTRDIGWAKPRNNEKKELKKWNKSVLTLQPVSFSDDIPHVSKGYLFSLGWHLHTFSFITNASVAKLELWEENSYIKLRVPAGIYLPNSEPIDLEEFISMVT